MKSIFALYGMILIQAFAGGAQADYMTSEFKTSKQLNEALQYQISEAVIFSSCSPQAPVYCDIPNAIYARDPIYVQSYHFSTIKSAKGNTYRVMERGLDRNDYQKNISFEVITSEKNKNIQVNIFLRLCSENRANMCRQEFLETISGTCGEGPSFEVHCLLENGRGRIFFKDSASFFSKSFLSIFSSEKEQKTVTAACRDLNLFVNYRSGIQETVSALDIFVLFRRQYAKELNMNIPPSYNLDQIPERAGLGTIVSIVSSGMHPKTLPTIVYHQEKGRICAGVLAEKLREHLLKNYRRELPRVEVHQLEFWRKSDKSTIEINWEKSGVAW